MRPDERAGAGIRAAQKEATAQKKPATRWRPTHTRRRREEEEERGANERHKSALNFSTGRPFKSGTNPVA